MTIHILGPTTSAPGPVTPALTSRPDRLRARISPLPDWRLKRVSDYVSAHLDQPLSLADLAALAGVSRMHFAAQFRAATGFRPHEYLLIQRIEWAKAILTTTDIPLVETAFSVGFQAQSHFSTVFKRFTGETPAGWRRVRRIKRAA